MSAVSITDDTLDDQIEDLSTEASEAGDLEQVALLPRGARWRRNGTTHVRARDCCCKRGAIVSARPATEAYPDELLELLDLYGCVPYRNTSDMPTTAELCGQLASVEASEDDIARARALHAKACAG